MFKEKYFILLIFIITSYNVFAESYPYSFLRYNFSARATAMGNAFEAVNSDASSVLLNPSSINTVYTKPFSFTFTKNIIDINSGNVAYVKDYDDIGVFAASVIYSNFGSFEETDKYGNIIGSFGANDLCLAVTYGNELDTNLYYGISVKYIYSNISKYSSSAIAFDAGLLYNLKDNRTSFGLSILNAGFQLASYDGENEKLPLDIRVGANHRLVGLPLLAAISFHLLADQTENFSDKFLSFSIGGEIYIGKYINLRIGYDNKIRQNTAPDSKKKLSGFSGGLGVTTESFNIDYGISQIGASFLIHKFSVYIDF